jgi:hypothetical protein
MVRSAQLIQKTVFLSVNNPLNPMEEIQDWVEKLCARLAAHSVTGMVLAGSDRWLCLLEGEAVHVEAIVQSIQRHIRPREWHVLMTDERARVRMFPQHRVGWRSNCSPLEMAAFLSDLRRQTSRTQLWHVKVNDVSALLEPVE